MRKLLDRKIAAQNGICALCKETVHQLRRHRTRPYPSPRHGRGMERRPPGQHSGRPLVVQRGKGIEQRMSRCWRVVRRRTTPLSTVRRISADLFGSNLPPHDLPHSIQNHSRQVHALGHYSCQTRRRPAYIRVPGQTNGRYDRGGNDQRRLHSRLLLHLLRPSLPLPRNRSLHFTHQCTTDRTGLGPSLYESFPRKISEGR